MLKQLSQCNDKYAMLGISFILFIYHCEQMDASCTLSNPNPEMTLSCYVTTLPYNVVRRIQIRIETYWRQGGFSSLDDAGRLVRRYRFHEHTSC